MQGSPISGRSAVSDSAPSATAPTSRHAFMPLMLLLVVLPLLFMLLYFHVVNSTLAVLGVSSQVASLFLIGSLLGSMVNIPLTRKRIQLASPRMAALPSMIRWLPILVHYYPPATVEEVVAINVGGALIPIGFSGYLLFLALGTSNGPAVVAVALLATLIVTIVSKLLARPVPGLGITLPSFVPPLLAAVTAYALTSALLPDARSAAVAVAYVCGSLGTLIGADLLNLPLVLRGGLLAAGPQRLWMRRGDQSQGDQGREPPRVLSIGGAGLFDGIFLTGIVAPFLITLIPH